MKFLRYIKLLNKSSYNSILITFIMVLILNIMMILIPGKFVALQGVSIIYPEILYYKISIWFNIPIIMMFIIALATDYLSSMRYLGFVGEKINNNKSIFIKIKTLSIITIILYFLTIINGYIICLNVVGDTSVLISIARIIFNTSIPLIFILAMIIMVIILTKANTIAIALLIGLYLIVEGYYPIFNLFIYITYGDIFLRVFKVQIIHLIMTMLFIVITVKKSKKIK